MNEIFEFEALMTDKHISRHVRSVDIGFIIQSPFASGNEEDDDFRPGITYIVAMTPKPVPKPPPSWDDAPEWVKWMAQDGDGQWWGYSDRPHTREESIHYFFSGCRMFFIDSGTPNPNWRDTLQRRPAPAPLCPVCGKPAGEHRDGLWCCGHCGGSARMLFVYLTGGLGNEYSVACSECDDSRTAGYPDAGSARAAWNRRA